jgi:hypothetical protein
MSSAHHSPLQRSGIIITPESGLEGPKFVLFVTPSHWLFLDMSVVGEGGRGMLYFLSFMIDEDHLFLLFSEFSCYL